MLDAYTLIALGLLSLPTLSFGVWFFVSQKYKSQIDDLHEKAQQYREHTLILQEKVTHYEQQNHHLRETQDTLVREKQRSKELEMMLAQEQKTSIEKINLLEKAKSEFKATFDSLSSHALERNNQAFMNLAQTTLEKFHMQSKGELKQREQAFSEIVSPIKNSLSNMDQKLIDFEKLRSNSFEVLKHQVNDLILSQKELRTETANLVKALRQPHVRGRWGEMQLKRVVEMSGMSHHCDFVEQITVEGDSGRLRPDMIVNLPGKKQIIIDAKAPLSAYLDALEAPSDVARQASLKDHARHVKKHILDLAKRDYSGQTYAQETPEFVVLFIPGETFFSAALEQDPSLIELGVEKRVIIATPATLIALLHAVAYGWRQETMAENARDISDLGKELYKRVSDLGSHFSKLGSDINSVMNSYNKTVGTLERRILPSARRFKDLDVVSMSDDIAVLQPVNQTTRELTAPEITDEKPQLQAS